MAQTGRIELFQRKRLAAEHAFGELHVGDFRQRTFLQNRYGM